MLGLGDLRRARLLAALASALLAACEIRFGHDDATSCGSCRLDHAKATCTKGQCTVEFCHFGYGDCDGVASNGCETDLRSAWRSCGLCGNACTNDVGCIDGSCSRSAEVTRTVLPSSTSVVLALDESHVYFAHLADISGVFRARKTGGVAEPLATASRVRALTVDQAHVYWLELPGPGDSTSLVRRTEKAPASTMPVTLATINGYPTNLVLRGEHLYVSAPAPNGEQLARVGVSGESPLEFVPGWDRPGAVFSVQPRGPHVVFGFSAADAQAPLVVEYAPELESFSILHEDLRGFVFTLDDAALYYEDTYASTDPKTSVISRRALADGSVQSIALQRIEYRSMRVDRGSLFLLDDFRGNLVEIDLGTFTPRVVFGAQRGVASVALDEHFVYFADGPRILRMPRR